MTKTKKKQLDWAAIPGTRRLDVDIADVDADADADADADEAKTRRGEIDSGDEEEFRAEKWTSRHYDDDDDDGYGDEKGEDADLFDPDPDARANKFDKGSTTDGANDAGMFLSLDVIPADSYRVERTGDEKSGFVTRVVLTGDKGPRASNDEGDDVSKQSAGRPKDAESSAPGGLAGGTAKGESPSGGGEDDSEKAPTTRKERRKAIQKIKRKARRDQARASKRLKKGPSESSPESSAKEAVDDADQEAVTQLQTTWSVSAPGVVLHPTLCRGLHSLAYAYPTPVQAATLPAAVLGRRDIVGAAPTGSGKTLSYGLPILQYLLDNADEERSNAGSKEDGGVGDVEDGPIGGAAASSQEQQQQTPYKKLPLQALVLTPTRELALQVAAELEKACCNSVKIGTIVGGFAEVKQRRTLEKTRPPVLVGTPGRLWELMSSNEYDHLNDLAQLRFLIVDEADRMISQGSFPQLRQIFDAINRANPAPEDSDDEGDDDVGDGDDDDRLLSLRGARGEAKLVMLDDSILAAVERERSRGGGGRAKRGAEAGEDEIEERRKRPITEEEESESNSEEEEEEEEEEEVQRVHRQTFVYSATLTLPPSMHRLIKKDHESGKRSSRKGKGKGRGGRATTVDGAIEEILDVAGACGELKVVDLSNAATPEGAGDKKASKKASRGTGKNSGDDGGGPSPLLARLPLGLTLGEIGCAQRHKDSHLYAYLVTTRQGSSGPCLVFCNSIAAVRRVGETLRVLGLPVKMLHAQMAQKSRLGALESLQKSNSRSVVVASDVAARGLDIASVTTVIHYDVARVVDTFIHRAGRTARGVGEKAVGTSISLVAPAEEREHHKICEAVLGAGRRSLEQVHIDGRLLNEAQERVALATKIVACDDNESQVSRKNKWLQDAAKEAGLEVDEDMMESGLLDGDRRDRQRFLEAKRAKGELRELLAKPMRKQNFGKFLSGAGLRESIKSEGEVKPFVVKKSLPKRNRRRKKAPKTK